MKDNFGDLMLMLKYRDLLKEGFSYEELLAMIGCDNAIYEEKKKNDKDSRKTVIESEMDYGRHVYALGFAKTLYDKELLEKVSSDIKKQYPELKDLELQNVSSNVLGLKNTTLD